MPKWLSLAELHVFWNEDHYWQVLEYIM